MSATSTTTTVVGEGARAFYAELLGRGVRLVAAPGGKLRVRGGLDRPDDLIRLKAHKQGLLNLLASEGDGRVSSPSSPSSPTGSIPHKSAAFVGDDGGDAVFCPAQTASPKGGKGGPRFLSEFKEAASGLGLVAMWSRHHGYVSVHDPTTGEWHDLRAEDAPGWAIPEARRRKRTREGGGG
jgi:hypothetical protein